MITIITLNIIALITTTGMTVPNTTGSEFELEETKLASVVEILVIEILGVEILVVEILGVEIFVVEIFVEITVIIKSTYHQ